MRAHRKSGRFLSEDEIRAEAIKRQKEMRGAARAAEITVEEVALEKRKGLAEKEAACRAATGQAGKDKHAAGEAKRRAATGQAGTVKRAAKEAARKAEFCVWGPSLLAVFINNTLRSLSRYCPDDVS
jgi:uncharacterized membrane protein YccC